MHGGSSSTQTHHVASASSSTAASALHVTKDNIAQLTFYQIFHLAAPHDDNNNSSSSSSERVLDTAALRRAYRRYSLVFHPDKDATPQARAAFERVALALETLSDPVKRQAYDAQLRDAAAAAASSSSSSHAFASQQRQQQQRAAEEEARWAADVLAQKEQTTALQSARAQREAARRAAAAQEMRDELTHACDTPARALEQALVREWNMDADLLAMKRRDVHALLRKLAALQPQSSRHRYDSDDSSSDSDGDGDVGVKRARDKDA